MPEVIVQVTEKGEVVGPVDRKLAHSEGFIHAVSLIFIFSPGGEGNAEGGWFQVRGLEKELYPGHLSPTAAGHIQFQDGLTLVEMAEHTAQEELQQEIGVTDVTLTLMAQGFLGVANDRQYMYIFVGRADKLDMKLQEEEVSEVRRLSLAEFYAFIKTGKVTPFTLEALRLLNMMPEGE